MKKKIKKWLHRIVKWLRVNLDLTIDSKDSGNQMVQAARKMSPLCDIQIRCVPGFKDKSTDEEGVTHDS